MRFRIGCPAPCRKAICWRKIAAFSRPLDDTATVWSLCRRRLFNSSHPSCPAHGVMEKRAPSIVRLRSISSEHRKVNRSMPGHRPGANNAETISQESFGCSQGSNIFPNISTTIKCFNTRKWKSSESLSSRFASRERSVKNGACI